MMRRAALLLVAVMLGAPPARATVLLDWTLEERIARADSVVVGAIVGQKAVREGEMIFTESTVKVEQVLLGGLQRTVVVRQLGGTIGDESVDVAGAAQLTVGERVVLILKNGDAGKSELIGMSAGAFTLKGTSARQRIDVPLLQRDGQMLAAPGERVVDLRVINELAARVRQAVR